jgi:hypothetical protein
MLSTSDSHLTRTSEAPAGDKSIFFPNSGSLDYVGTEQGDFGITLQGVPISEDGFFLKKKKTLQAHAQQIPIRLPPLQKLPERSLYLVHEAKATRLPTVGIF